MPAEPPGDVARDQLLALRSLGQALRDAQDYEGEARARLYAAVADYLAAGGSQSRAAREAGLDRMTVRKIAGLR